MAKFLGAQLNGMWSRLVALSIDICVLRLVVCGKILYNLVIGPFGDIMTRTLPKLFLVFFLSVGTPERDIFLEKARI